MLAAEDSLRREGAAVWKSRNLQRATKHTRHVVQKKRAKKILANQIRVKDNSKHALTRPHKDYSQSQ